MRTKVTVTVVLLILISLAPFAHAVGVDDFKVLTEVCIYEASNASEKEKIAVIHVVLNRTADKRFPSSITDVVYQPYQFSYTLLESRRIPTERELLACEKAVAKAIKLPRHTYNHYYLNQTKYAIEEPSWAKNPKDSKQFDKHIFIRI